MSHAPSPLQATSDQAAIIAALVAAGEQHGVDVDAGPLDVDATDMCANDWAHGWATVCLPGHPETVCPGCVPGWLYWHTGAHVAIDVLRVPGAGVKAVAA